MAGEVGQAFVSIVPTMKGAGRQIEAGLNRGVGPAADKAGATAGKRFGSRFSAGLKGAAAGAFGAVAAAKTIGFLKEATAEAREAQKVGATTNQIIKATGGVANVTAAGIGKLSESISNKTGVDDEAIQTGANLLLTFKNVRNEAGKGNKVFDQATQAAVDLSAAGFGSIDSASKMLGKALNDPVKGITALSRAGVTFTDQQKEQIKTLVASGDVLGAQKIILGEVQSQVGGVAAASATSGEKLTTTFNNFKESIGTALLPTIDGINNKLIQFFGWLQNNRPVLIGLGIIVGGILVGAFAALAVAVIAATWPFLLAGIAVAALVAGFIYAYKHSETFRRGVQLLGAGALAAGANLLRMASNVVRAMAWTLTALGKIKGDKFQWARDGAKALNGVADKLDKGAVKADLLAQKLAKVPPKKDSKVTTTKLDKPITDTEKLTKNLGKIPPSKASKVTVNSLSKPIDETATLATNISKLKSKEITITTHYESTGTPPKKASGGIIAGARRVTVGEAGPEAIVPLDRPLNMVDPSVRWLAAYAQGKTDLSAMQPISLGDLSTPGDDSASHGPARVYVVNADEVAAGTQRVAEGVVGAERAFASTMNRMG